MKPDSKSKKSRRITKDVKLSINSESMSVALSQEDGENSMAS
jgi:hypothetical protein